MASNIRVNSNPTGNIHINANDERPRYAGYTITAERSQTEHGTLITAEDWRGITESMVYDGVGIETLVYNDDFTVTITLMDGRTFTTEDTIARGVDQAESAAEHALESQRAASASEEAAAGSATQSSAAAGSALAYANRAETAAVAASTSANRAQASAESIDGILEAVTALEASTTQKANEARDYATQASGSASTATTKAAEAAQSASSAATDASRAESYRTDALNAKAAAETAADNAEASETSANASAVEASTYASNASASATASATSASEAEASAQASAQSAATVYSLLPADTASGDIASFPDGANAIPMDYLKVSLEPIQDLHGYDKPWSGGAGANKWDEEWEQGIYDSTNGQKATRSGFIRCKNKIPVLPNTAYYYKQTSEYGEFGRFCFYDADENFVSYDSGRAYVNNAFTTPSNAYYITFYVSGTAYSNGIAINYPSSVTTYSPYSNICPISGHTECVTEVCGKNLFDKTTALDGYIDDANGQLSGSAPFKSTDYIHVVGENSYYIVSEQTLAMWGAWYDESKSYISGITAYANQVITAPSNASYVRLTIKSSNTGNVDTFAVNYPSTDHEYHAYNGNTYTTTLGRTVYGGTLDVVSGELVVDRAMVTLNGTERWSIYTITGVNQLYTPISDLLYQANTASVISDKFNSIPIQQREGNYNTVYAYTAGVGFNVEGYSQTSWNEFLVQNPVQIVYELATPQTIQLTPQEVRTLLGQNNVWSDGVYHPLVKRYLKDNTWSAQSLNGVTYYVNQGYGYMTVEPFASASMTCSHFKVARNVEMPTSTSTPLADNGVYLIDNGKLLVRYDAVEDADPTVSLQNWVNFVTSNNVYLTVPSYSDTASDSLEVELEYRADVALWVERKLHE